jgi:hypothetical protein
MNELAMNRKKKSLEKCIKEEKSLRGLPTWR